MAEKPRPGAGRKIWRLHPNVFFMGLTSLLTDVSSEMIFTLMPLFLANVLGAGGTIIGLVGGLSEGADAIFRIFSGWFSDRLGRRKGLAVTGYGISTLAKPFLLLASAGWGVVLAVRFTDRVGKGVRTSSRDALIADSSAPEERGRAFGLHRAMDTSGAFLGLVIAALIIYFVQGAAAVPISLSSFQWLVIGGIIPAVLAVILLQALVQERKRQPMAGDSQGGFYLSRIKDSFSTRFWIFLVIMFVFTLGNSSDFFVILRAQNLGAPLLQVVLMLILHNAVYAGMSLPMGILSDRVGRRRIIVVGWSIYALVYLGFAVSSSIWQIYLLFAAYGVYYGVTEGVAKAFIADLAPAEKRGTAFGLYHGVVGLTLVAASLIAGLLWDKVSTAAPFYFGAGLAFLAMLGMLTLIRGGRQKPAG